MKKVLVIAALGVFVLASCKKDRTCECCYTYNGVKSCASATAKLSKKDAKTWCEGYTTGDGYSCELK